MFFGLIALFNTYVALFGVSEAPPSPLLILKPIFGSSIPFQKKKKKKKRVCKGIGSFVTRRLDHLRKEFTKQLYSQKNLHNKTFLTCFVYKKGLNIIFFILYTILAKLRANNNCFSFSPPPPNGACPTKTGFCGQWEFGGWRYLPQQHISTPGWEAQKMMVFLFGSFSSPKAFFSSANSQLAAPCPSRACGHHRRKSREKEPNAMKIVFSKKHRLHKLPLYKDKFGLYCIHVCTYRVYILTCFAPATKLYERNDATTHLLPILLCHHRIHFLVTADRSLRWIAPELVSRKRRGSN